mgnify:CR=1 FL=1
MPCTTPDPSEAERFCRELDLAAFAAAIGTAHGYYKGEPDVKFDLIGEINRRTNTPMALHGGTGLNDEIIQKCIKLGCAKINISTNLKHVLHRQLHRLSQQKNNEVRAAARARRAVRGAEAALQGKDRAVRRHESRRAKLLVEGRLSSRRRAVHEGPDLRLRRCARRHRARRPSRRVQPRVRSAQVIDAEWDVDLYGELLKIAGGKERMTHYFNEARLAERQDARETLIPELHKTQDRDLHRPHREAASLPLRPGISRIVDEAHAAGVRLGVCTTSDPKAIDGVLDLFGAQRKSWFEIVLAGDVVTKKKPDPEIYNLAKAKLGLDGARLRRRRGQPQRLARRARRGHADADHDEHLHHGRGFHRRRESRARARRSAERPRHAQGPQVASRARARRNRFRRG